MKQVSYTAKNEGEVMAARHSRGLVLTLLTGLLLLAGAGPVGAEPAEPDKSPAFLGEPPSVPEQGTARSPAPVSSLLALQQQTAEIERVEKLAIARLAQAGDLLDKANDARGFEGIYRTRELRAQAESLALEAHRLWAVAQARREQLVQVHGTDARSGPESSKNIAEWKATGLKIAGKGLFTSTPTSAGLFPPRVASRQPPGASSKENQVGAGATTNGPPHLDSAPTPYSSPPALAFVTESQKIDGLVAGSAAVSAPSTARASEPFSVYLRVSPTSLESLLRSMKEDFPENSTVKGKPKIKLTPRMVANVSGHGFEILPKDGMVQAVSATDETTWNWQVTPLEAGALSLTFTLAGTLIVEGKEVPRNFYHYKQKVDVAVVSPMAFLVREWRWIITTLALPALGAFWALFRKPKDSSGKAQPSLAQKLRERRRSHART